MVSMLLFIYHGICSSNNPEWFVKCIIILAIIQHDETWKCMFWDRRVPVIHSERWGNQTSICLRNISIWNNTKTLSLFHIVTHRMTNIFRGYCVQRILIHLQWQKTVQNRLSQTIVSYCAVWSRSGFLDNSCMSNLFAFTWLLNNFSHQRGPLCPAHTMGSRRAMNDWTVDKANAFRSSDRYQSVQIYALKNINKHWKPREKCLYQNLIVVIAIIVIIVIDESWHSVVKCFCIFIIDIIIRHFMFINLLLWSMHIWR